MKVHFGRETALVALTALPPTITAGLLFAGGEWAARFIELQLVATTVFTVGSLGVAVVLASLPLQPRQAPAPWATILPTVVLALLAAVSWLIGRPEQVAVFAMAAVFFAAVLYRLPGQLFLSRGLLLAQFLPLLGPAGTAALCATLVLAHAHLASRGAYRPPEAPVDARSLAGAWFLSTVKDGFFRGHYLVLSLFGLASPAYAILLRYVDLLSRPTDYLFQRLVDHGAIGGRFGRVLWLVPAIGLVSGAAWYFVGTAPEWHFEDSILVACASALVVLVKYLSFCWNAQLRHAGLSAIYVASLTVAAPALALGDAPMYPLPFLLATLGVALLLLLRFGTPAHGSTDSLTGVATLR